jgi:hypothetical protein
MSLADLAALRDAAPPPGGETESGAGYGSMRGLEMVEAPEGLLFFRYGELAVAHVPDPSLTRDELARFTAGDVPRLRSRAGKHAWVHARADEGLAVTEEDRRVRYVEVFPPTTFDDYRERIHVEPPKFVE